MTEELNKKWCGAGDWKKKQMIETMALPLATRVDKQPPGLLFLPAVPSPSAAAHTPCGPFHLPPGFYLQANSAAMKV